MLKRENRLKITGKNSPVRVFNSPLFIAKISDGSGSTKFGFVVSKKVSKSAVVRNRAKRVLRESAGEVLKKIIPGKNILIISKSELGFEQKEEVVDSLIKVFTKAEIII